MTKKPTQSDLAKYKYEELKPLYHAKKIPEKQIFEYDKPGKWCMGMFMSGKLIKVEFNLTDKRLERLKKSGQKRLEQIISQEGWTPTRQAPWLPQRWQNAKTGDVLWTATSMKEVLEEAKRDKTLIQDASIDDLRNA